MLGTTEQLAAAVGSRPSNLLDLVLVKYTKLQCKLLRGKVSGEELGDLVSYLGSRRKKPAAVRTVAAADTIDLRAVYASFCPSTMMRAWPRGRVFPPPAFPLVDLYDEGDDYARVQVTSDIYVACMRKALALNRLD